MLGTPVTTGQATLVAPDDLTADEDGGIWVALWGGPIVTTARHGLDDAALSRQPHAGHVFCIGGLGPRGAPCALYRGRTTPS